MSNGSRRPAIRALLGSFALLASLVAASSTAGAVAGVDTIPSPDQYMVVAGGTLTVPAGGITANDYGPIGDVMVEAAPSNAANIVVGTDGSFTYTPDAGFVGIDSMRYSLVGPAGTSPSTSVTINVTGPAPTTAVADVYVTGMNETLTIPASGLLANDFDPQGEALTAVNITAARRGVVLPAADGSFSFTPLANWEYIDEFTYQVSDGVNVSAPITVLINVFGEGEEYGCRNQVVTIVGTPDADTIFGTNGPDVILARGGDDKVYGLAGDDFICGNGEKDRIFGGAGADVLHGGDGIDKIRGGPGENTIYGGPGQVDFLKGGPDNDQIFGGAGHNRIRASGGDDIVYGGDEFDWIWGGPGDDRLFGDLGDDILSGSGGDDLCHGGPGTDRASTGCETLIEVP